MQQKSISKNQGGTAPARSVCALLAFLLMVRIACCVLAVALLAIFVQIAGERLNGGLDGYTLDELAQAAIANEAWRAAANYLSGALLEQFAPSADTKRSHELREQLANLLRKDQQISKAKRLLNEPDQQLQADLKRDYEA